MSQLAAVYCRISRDRVGAGLGVERQESDCRELASRLGWTVVAVHIDNDLSAYSGKPRPGYKALLADLASGRCDAVLAWHTDRLHRSPTELEAYIGVCEQSGVPTHCVKAGPLDLSTASGKMTARITGAVARHEVEHMIERQKSAKLQAAKSGRYRGGRRPFGFEPDGVTVRPEEAVRLADASTRVLRGESLSSIARELNARGVTSARGGPWTSVAVRRLLLRPRNAGLVELAGGQIAAPWPPIVPEATWRALCVLCARPDRRAARSTEARWLGSGLYRCGVCDDGTIMRAAVSRGAVYRCKARAHLARSANPIDEWVAEVAIARLSRDDAALLLRTADTSADLDALSEEAAALRVRQAGLVGLFADGVITAAEVAEGKTRMAARLAELAAAMAAATVGSPLAGFADSADVRACWEAATVPRRKSVVDALMAVTLCSPGQGAKRFDPDSVRIAWRHA